MIDVFFLFLLISFGLHAAEFKQKVSRISHAEYERRYCHFEILKHSILVKGSKHLYSCLFNLLVF
jgi:hypothetical protein